MEPYEIVLGHRRNISRNKGWSFFERDIMRGRNNSDGEIMC